MRRIAEHCHFFPSDVTSTGLVTATSTIRSEQFRNRRSIMRFRLGLAFPTGSLMRFRVDLVVGMPSQRQRRLRRAAFWWQISWRSSDFSSSCLRSRFKFFSLHYMVHAHGAEPTAMAFASTVSGDTTLRCHDTAAHLLRDPGNPPHRRSAERVAPASCIRHNLAKVQFRCSFGAPFNRLSKSRLGVR